MAMNIIQNMSKPIQRVSLSPCAKYDVVCFPWAGGNRSSLNPLYKALSQESVNIYCINYAVSGPLKRFSEVSDLVKVLTEEFLAWLSTRSKETNNPIVFFGYSYGGLVAYELAAALKDALSVDIVNKHVLCAISSPQFLTLKNERNQGALFLN